MTPLIRVRPPMAARSHRRSSTGDAPPRLSAASAHALAYQSDSGSLTVVHRATSSPSATTSSRPNSLSPAHPATTANTTFPIARRTTARPRPAVSSLAGFSDACRSSMGHQSLTRQASARTLNNSRHFRAGLVRGVWAPEANTSLSGTPVTLNDPELLDTISNV